LHWRSGLRPLAAVQHRTRIYKEIFAGVVKKQRQKLPVVKKQRQNLPLGFTLCGFSLLGFFLCGFSPIRESPYVVFLHTT
jgi:hypothetical protein